MEARKLFSQMTESEKTLLNSFIGKGKCGYRMGVHAIKREKEKIITHSAVRRALEDGNIIEYHFKDANRILVRGNVDEGNFNVCVVLEVDNNSSEIITVYDNEISDKHFTLNRSIYRKNFDIASMFKKKKNRGNNGCFGNTYNKNNIKSCLV